MRKVKTLAPWDDKDHQTGKHELLRFVTCCIVVTNFLIIFFGILAATRASRVGKLTEVELGTVVGQVVEDWQAQPFVSIELVTEGECPAGTEPVFSRLWEGTVEGCDAGEEETLERFAV